MNTVGVLLTLAIASPAAGDTEAWLEEVVVTAQKRAESAQDVPVAVTAMTGPAIEQSGLLTLTQLTQMHPSVSFDVGQNFWNASLKIRGIGTVGNARNFEGAVGVFVDGVYRSRSGMALTDLYDVDQIEVLRGPQGTLFGRNTVAGAITVQSRAPLLDTSESAFEMRLGNHNSRFFAGMVNLPSGDRSALRAAATVNRRDAFVISPDNGDEYDAIDRFHLKAQWLLNRDDLEVQVLADYGESDARCCFGSPTIINGPVTPLIETFGALNGRTLVPAPQAEQDRRVSLSTRPREETEDWGVTLKISKAFDTATLSSITAYRGWENNQTNTDPDFGPADLLLLDEPTTVDNFSQELNLSTTVGDSDLLVGLYYAREDYDSVNLVDTGADADNYVNALISASLGATACLPPLVSADCAFPVGIGALFPDGRATETGYRQDSEVKALFVHADTPLGDRFNLVTGLRYSQVTKDGGVDNRFWYDSPVVRAALAAQGVPDDGTPRNGFDLSGTSNSPSFDDATRDSEVSGTLSLRFRPNEGVMLYGGYSRGYKSSGVNLFREGAITDTTTYDAETADTFEVGVKMDYLDDRARSNVALFHTEFSDLQINFFDGLNFRTENTGKASTEGIEIENEFHFSDSLRADLSVTYMDARFDRVDNPLLSYLVGRETPRAPDFSGVLALTWERPLTEGVDGFARGLASYTGEHYVSPDIADEQQVSGYTLTDLSIGIRHPGQDWEITLWCQNCGDETYRTILVNTPFQPGSVNAFLGPPRQYGMTFRKRF